MWKDNKQGLVFACHVLNLSRNLAYHFKRTDLLRINSHGVGHLWWSKISSCMVTGQGSAKVQDINHDVERNWIRTAIYHTLLTMSAPKELNSDDLEFINYIKEKIERGEKVLDFMKHQYEEKLKSTQVKYGSFGWNEVKNKPTLQDAQLAGYIYLKV